MPLGSSNLEIIVARNHRLKSVPLDLMSAQQGLHKGSRRLSPS